MMMDLLPNLIQMVFINGQFVSAALRLMTAG
jgi:hypothetical protein